MKDPDYTFSQILAFAETSAVAREVIETYGEESNFHPVGTWPYMLDKYVRSSKIFLKANPDYRKEVWDFKAGSDPVDKEIVAKMKGKHLVTHSAKLPIFASRSEPRSANVIFDEARTSMTLSRSRFIR